jgi:hypothetical protein
MRPIYILFLLGICAAMIQCADDPGDPFYTDIYGWIRKSSDSTGVNGLNLRIYDIDPEDLNNTRIRERTTAVYDSIDGFFQIDSVIFGTTKMQGVGYVSIVVDSTNNPGWPSQIWQPSLRGSVDSIILYINED